MMPTVGLVLAVFGGVFVFAGAFALSLMRNDGETSAAKAADFFPFMGIIRFCRGLVRGIAEGMRSRRSSAFPPLVIFGTGLLLLAAGFTLMGLAGGW